MKLSTRTRYGIRAMLDLARNNDGEPMQLKNIAKHQEISVKYLEQLIAILKSAGFVRSIRGSKGGYMLARAPEKIKLNEIFGVLEGSVATVECVENQDQCARAADCVVRDVWVEVQKAIEGVLSAITLRDLAERAKNNTDIDYQI